ncbi:hypothetical protein METP3_03041 [Methanosarcinales archaeon]|nr:hypothetical protein METP3_03041 [Methanosarcinales archaeon]
MRDRVNVSIDHRLKNMFEALMESHGIEWNELLEGAVIDFLTKIDPVQTLEDMIKNEEEKLQERKLELIKIKANIHVLDHPKFDHLKMDRELEKKREEQFQKDILWLPKQILSPEGPNWNRILFFYHFDTKKEALDWLRPRIERIRELEKKK